jgi:hypothetical protein
MANGQPRTLEDSERRAIRRYMLRWFGPSAIIIAVLSALGGFFVNVSLTQTHDEAVRQADVRYQNDLLQTYRDATGKVIDVLRDLATKTSEASVAAKNAQKDAETAVSSTLGAKEQAVSAAEDARKAAQRAKEITDQAYQAIGNRLLDDQSFVSSLGGAADKAVKILQTQMNKLTVVVADRRNTVSIQNAYGQGLNQIRKSKDCGPGQVVSGLEISFAGVCLGQCAGDGGIPYIFDLKCSPLSVSSQ